MLDTFVVCDSNLHKFVNICQGCMKRERKRASRKKSRLPIEEAHWQQDKQKRAIVFNCREVIDFVSTADVDVNGTTVATKQLQLPVRMACYCRHHNEKVGFKAFFVISDYTGKVVGRASTNSIMITDDHKATTKRQSDDTTSTSENSHKRQKDSHVADIRDYIARVSAQLACFTAAVASITTTAITSCFCCRCCHCCY